jgi:hypothetical protein
MNTKILKKLNKQIDTLAAEAQAKIDARIDQFEKDYDKAIIHVFFEVILQKHNIENKIIGPKGRYKFAEIL